MREPRRHEILAAILTEPEGFENFRKHFRDHLAFGWKFARICDIRRLPYIATAEAIGYDLKRRGWTDEFPPKKEKKPKPPPAPPDGSWRDDEGYWHVPATTDGRSIRFYCLSCKKEHIHGDDGQAITHRISHCYRRESPLHSSNASKGFSCTFMRTIQRNHG